MTYKILDFKYDKDKFTHFLNNYKKSLDNQTNSNAFELIGTCDIYENDDNEQIGKIQFNNIKIHNNQDKVFSVTENICIQLSSGSIFALNHYNSNTFDGTYEQKKYIFKIISGTEKYIDSKGYIKVKVVNNIRYVKIYLEN